MEYIELNNIVYGFASNFKHNKDIRASFNKPQQRDESMVRKISHGILTQIFKNLPQKLKLQFYVV